MTASLLASEINALTERIYDQASRHPASFPFTRDGLRLAIASMEDELQELWECWNNDKRHLGNGKDDIKHELLDIAAIAMQAYHEIVVTEVSP